MEEEVVSEGMESAATATTGAFRVNPGEWITIMKTGEVINLFLFHLFRQLPESGLMTPRTPCDFQTQTVYENIPELRMPPQPTPPKP